LDLLDGFGDEMLGVKTFPVAQHISRVDLCVMIQ
jgi:hypothetical protein